jgi:hypothetical protein
MHVLSEGKRRNKIAKRINLNLARLPIPPRGHRSLPTTYNQALFQNYCFVSHICIPKLWLMGQNTPTQDHKREEHLSKDGKWRSFPRVPHLLQYVSNGNYYGRIKLNGKLIRESLETAVWTTATLKPKTWSRISASAAAAGGRVTATWWNFWRIAECASIRRRSG